MNPVIQEIQVAFRYAVYFTTGVFDPGNPLLRDVLAVEAGELPVRVVFVIDGGVARAHRGLRAAIKRYAGPEAKVVVVPGGEKAKNQPRHLKQILRAINESGLCRHS